jgi:nicotinamide mononucleotide transporter
MIDLMASAWQAGLHLVVEPALQQLAASAFTVWGAPVSRGELVAFVLALWMVGCNLRVNPLGWPLAIVSSLLYFGLFWQSKLYGDACLQLMFVVLAGWGWRQWLRGRDEAGQALAVRALPAVLRTRLLIATLLGWPALGVFLARFTDTDVPYWDAFPTAASITGQWLLGRKYIENWAVWLLVNTVSVGLLVYKQLWLTAVLYSLFVLLSAWGWRSWRLLAQQRVSPVPAG